MNCFSWLWWCLPLGQAYSLRAAAPARPLRRTKWSRWYVDTPMARTTYSILATSPWHLPGPSYPWQSTNPLRTPAGPDQFQTAVSGVLEQQFGNYLWCSRPRCGPGEPLLCPQPQRDRSSGRQSERSACDTRLNRAGRSTLPAPRALVVPYGDGQRAATRTSCQSESRSRSHYWSCR